MTRGGARHGEPAEPTYHRVLELQRAGLTTAAACQHIANAEGLNLATVKGRFYSVQKRIGREEEPAREPAREPGPAPALALVVAEPDPDPEPPPPPPEEAAPASESLADVLDWLASCVADLATDVTEIVRDAAKWRAFVELAESP